jgi:pectinesterase
MNKYPLLLFVIIISTTAHCQVTGQFDFVVAQDGTGDFKTIQESINAVPDFRKMETKIFIKKGIYKEN